MMAAWKAAQAAGGTCVLVTVVATRGSSYRSPGARMLVLPDGSRIGAVSGGCLEGELCRRAHWWTAKSAAVLRRFDTSNQEDNEGFGLGCGGSIDLLLERLEPNITAERIHPLLAQERVTESRATEAVALVVEAAPESGLRVGARYQREAATPEMAAPLERAVALGASFTAPLADGSRVFFEVLLPPVQLLVCGAGADAQPMVELATVLGWSATVLGPAARPGAGGALPCCGPGAGGEGCGSAGRAAAGCTHRGNCDEPQLRPGQLLSAGAAGCAAGVYRGAGVAQADAGSAGRAGPGGGASAPVRTGGLGHRRGDPGADRARHPERDPGLPGGTARRCVAGARRQHPWA